MDREAPDEYYRSVFESMGLGFCELELIRDAQGFVVDQHYIEFNGAFERIFGIPVSEARGRKASEVFPTLETWWHQAFGEIADRGVPDRIEHKFDSVGLWFEVFVHPRDGDRLTVIYQDITEQKLAQMVAQEGGKRQDFLLRFSDALRAEQSEDEIKQRALQLISDHLRLDRCFIGVFDLAEDRGDFTHQVGNDTVPPMPPSLKLSLFPDALRVSFEGTLVVHDAATDPYLTETDKRSFVSLGMNALVAATLRKGVGVPLWSIVTVSSSPRHWTLTQIALIEEVTERTYAAVERARTEAALRESEARFRQFSDASTDILWIRDARTLDMLFASPAFDRIYGTPGPERGGDKSLRSWARLIEPESRKLVLSNFRRVRAGEQIDMEFRIKRASDGALRWIHNTDFPLRDAAGAVRWLAGIGADVTPAKEAVDRQGVLVAELQHRTRNLIGVIHSLSDRTVENATSLEDFSARFEQRLSALSRVQGLLSHLASGDKVTFDELLRAELSAHGALDGTPPKVLMEGPSDIPLRSVSVQTLALALHELSTNAVKYGALRSPEGRLSIRWRVQNAGPHEPSFLHIEWIESGVVMPDTVAPATGSGYGRELIEHALPYQSQGRTTYELGADGVRCTIAIPISRLYRGNDEHE